MWLQPLYGYLRYAETIIFFNFLNKLIRFKYFAMFKFKANFT